MIIEKILVTEELVLKPITNEDSLLIFNALTENRDFLRRWLPFVDTTKSIKDTQSFVKSIVDDVERRQEIFTIWYKDEFIGLVGLKDIDYLNRKLEIGYWLIEKFTKRGFMTLSVERIIQFVFEKLEMNRIQIKCGLGNFPSSAIPKKLSFSLEGIERQGERHVSRYIDLEVYSLLKNEWIK